MPIKILKEDSRFSRWIRDRDGWRCQRCGNQYDQGSQGLQNSHFWSRRFWSTRFDPDNCDALCYGCHSLVESNKQGWYRSYKIQKLGRARYNALERRANMYKKKEIAIQEAKQWLKEHGY